MQLFSADATMFSFFFPMKTWKNRPQKLLIIGPIFFFITAHMAKNWIAYRKYVHLSTDLCLKP